MFILIKVKLLEPMGRNVLCCVCRIVMTTKYCVPAQYYQTDAKKMIIVIRKGLELMVKYALAIAHLNARKVN